MSESTSLTMPSDDEMAEIVNSRIRTGLKGKTDKQRDCDHPYCLRPNSPRLRGRDGVYDTLCWHHRFKRGVYTALFNALFLFPLSLLLVPGYGWNFALLFGFVAWLTSTLWRNTLDEPRPSHEVKGL